MAFFSLLDHGIQMGYHLSITAEGTVRGLLFACSSQSANFFIQAAYLMSEVFYFLLQLPLSQRKKFLLLGQF
jgi:hypothetical protein